MAFVLFANPLDVDVVVARLTDFKMRGYRLVPERCRALPGEPDPFEPVGPDQGWSVARPGRSREWLDGDEAEGSGRGRHGGEAGMERGKSLSFCFFISSQTDPLVCRGWPSRNIGAWRDAQLAIAIVAAQRQLRCVKSPLAFTRANVTFHFRDCTW